MQDEVKTMSVGAMLARIRWADARQHKEQSARARQRWANATEEERREQGRKMAAGRRKTRKHRQAKVRGNR